MGCAKKPWFNTLAVFVCLLGLVGLSGSTAFAADETGGWKWKADASAEFAYDTNIYKLSSTQVTRLETNSTSNQTSERFNDMDSVDDFIFTPRVRASFRHSGLMGRKFSVRPSVAYNKYVHNQEKSYFDFGLDIKQAVGKRGTIGLEFGYAPNIYKKNYLTGAVDVNGDGISSSEKVFSPAHYDKTNVIVSYGRRLWKSRQKQSNTLALDAVSAHILAGYEVKSYDDPFTIRDEDSLLAGFDLELTLHKNTSLAFNYLFKSIDTTVGTELLIRDEPDFGVDFNGDADMTDLNFATVQNVDRSRNNHTVGVKVSTRLRKDWSGYARYEARFTSYKSEEQFDVTRLDRTDVRQKVGLGLKGRLAPKWSLGIDWVLTHNAAARDGLVITDQAEQKSYDKNVFSAIITYRL